MPNPATESWVPDPSDFGREFPTPLLDLLQTPPATGPPHTPNAYKCDGNR